MLLLLLFARFCLFFSLCDVFWLIRRVLRPSVGRVQSLNWRELFLDTECHQCQTLHDFVTYWALLVTLTFNGWRETLSENQYHYHILFIFLVDIYLCYCSYYLHPLNMIGGENFASCEGASPNGVNSSTQTMGRRQPWWCEHPSPNGVNTPVLMM